MKLDVQNPPREFEVGFEHKRTIKDCAHIALEADEQVTFTTPDGGEYDLTRKSWGFYATPSINSRLTRFGLRAVLVKNRLGHLFVLLLENGHEADFEQYLTEEQLEVLLWIDNADSLPHQD
jgi:hypothetical protein